MNKYWIQYRVQHCWMENLEKARIISGFVTTEDLEDWCYDHEIDPSDIIKVVKL